MKKARWKGYVIARRLEDFNGKVRPFTYYPSKPCGKPPFLYKSKKSADRVRNGKNFPFKDRDTIVTKFKPEMYLDRY